MNCKNCQKVVLSVLSVTRVAVFLELIGRANPMKPRLSSAKAWQWGGVPEPHLDAWARLQIQKPMAVSDGEWRAWWGVARDDFAQLRDGKKMPEVRHELPTTIKDKLIPLGVLDEFKSAGVFVN
jgi:hypothetical protein